MFTEQRRTADSAAISTPVAPEQLTVDNVLLDSAWRYVCKIFIYLFADNNNHAVAHNNSE